MLTREWAKTNPRLGSLPTSASAGMSSCGHPGLRVSGPYLENKGRSELFQQSTASPCLRLRAAPLGPICPALYMKRSSGRAGRKAQPNSRPAVSATGLLPSPGAGETPRFPALSSETARFLHGHGFFLPHSQLVRNRPSPPMKGRKLPRRFQKPSPLPWAHRPTSGWIQGPLLNHTQRTGKPRVLRPRFLEQSLSNGWGHHDWGCYPGPFMLELGHSVS